MEYEIGVRIRYRYRAPAGQGRQLLRLRPAELPGVQHVTATDLTVEPKPADWTIRQDFFGNRCDAISIAENYETLSIRMMARVQVSIPPLADDLSLPVAAVPEAALGRRDLGADAPAHFLAASPRVELVDAITAYARKVTQRAATAGAAVAALGRALHADMRFDAEATTVTTRPSEAFASRRGVCQDFSHVMIAGLRGIGVPAGYVSGFLRTVPPPGKPRLEGADAMHAWVRAWCGPQAGWLAYDPTNAMPAGADHVVVAHGRDYGDVSPVVGMARSAAGHRTDMAVDVIARP